MDTALTQKITIAETLLRDPQPAGFSLLCSVALQHKDEMAAMPPSRMVSIIRGKYEEARVIPCQTIQYLIHILDRPEADEIHAMLFRLPEEKREKFFQEAMSFLSDPENLQDAFHQEEPEILLLMSGAKTFLQEMSDASDSRFLLFLKKWIPTLILSLVVSFMSSAGEKAIDNIWPDSTDAEIRLLLQKRNEIEEEQLCISREILLELRKSGQTPGDPSTDASIPTRTSGKNTQLRQAQTDNQMDISKTPLG